MSNLAHADEMPADRNAAHSGGLDADEGNPELSKHTQILWLEGVKGEAVGTDPGKTCSETNPQS